MYDPITKRIRGLGASKKGGLPVVGTPVYAEHPSTEIVCLYYDLKDGRGRRGWYPGTPSPADLLAYIASGGIIEAFNVTFEFYIWNLVGVRMFGWPALQLENCRCVMARARRQSLPGGLDNVCKALGTPPKDKDGHKIMMKVSRPQSPTKARKGLRWTPSNAWDDYVKLYSYCSTDVYVEDCAAARIPDLTPTEHRLWQMDQRINVRGVQVDTKALDDYIDILAKATDKYTIELQHLTEGKVGGVNETAKYVAWLNARNGQMVDLKAPTVTEALKRKDLTPEVRRALEIRDSLGSANVKKLRTLKLQVSSDGRLRDQYMYCGADRTGRASAGGVQLQNITSKGPKSCRCTHCGEFFGAKANPAQCPHCLCSFFDVMPDWTVEAVESAIRVLATRELYWVEKIWGDPIALLCGCLRGLFIAKQGHELICCDFSAIEAVAAACLSRCQWRIDVFSGHGKIYEESAAKATGIPLQEILDYKKKNGQSHPARKTIGKVRELAGGYGGWIGAWINFGADDFMTEAEIKADVLKWRAESPEIVEMWGGQFRQTGAKMSEGYPELYGLEGAAIQAILNPGQCFGYIDISYAVYNDILYCRLPSGRFLHYHKPAVTMQEGKYGKPGQYQITFWGYNSNSQKGPIGWVCMETYGGRLFENVVQAVSADIQFEALYRCEAKNYPIVMHTHDEGSAEVPLGFGSVDEMCELMAERPSWASWWPLRAAGWRHKRYQKD